MGWQYINPRFISLALLYLFLLIGSNTAGAQSEQRSVAPIVRGLVADVEGIRRSARVNQEINSWFDQERNRLNEQVQREEDALRQAQEALLAREAQMDEPAFREEMDALNANFLELALRVREERARLNQEMEAHRTTLDLTLRSVLVGIAQERRATFLFDKRSIIVSVQGSDISNEALRRLDARLPTLNLLLSETPVQDEETQDLEDSDASLLVPDR